MTIAGVVAWLLVWPYGLAALAGRLAARRGAPLWAALVLAGELGVIWL